MWLIRQCIEHWQARVRTWNLDHLLASLREAARARALLHVDEPDLLLPGNMLHESTRNCIAPGSPPFRTIPMLRRKSPI